MTKDRAKYNCSSVDVRRVSWRRKLYNLKSDAQPPPSHPYASVDTLRLAALSSSMSSLRLPRSLHQLPREFRTLASLHNRRAPRPSNLSGQAFITCTPASANVTSLFPVNQSTKRLTEPILNKLPLHSARRTISHDLEKARALAPTEAVGQQRGFVLRISSLRRGETRHARVGDLLDGDFRGGEEGCGFVPDGLVEREGVGKEAIGSATCAVVSVSGQCLNLCDEGSIEMD